MLLRTWLPYDWTPRSEAYFVFPLAQGTPGKQCGLAATGDYQPSLRSPWLAAKAVIDRLFICAITHLFFKRLPHQTQHIGQSVKRRQTHLHI
ncbi:hypothetical protein, partial [Thiolapillus sp.]|uniref:hypothetical protein n=1 Tax=Thiolapillus sp. TaxID=2017437 RepID=UPI003AF5C5F6